MNQCIKRIADLRETMKRKGLDACLIPGSDDHNSEYVGDYFKVREFFSGFTGSNGTLVVTEDGAYLWTDGRYFIQAEKELEGSDIVLMKTGEKNVPSVPAFLSEQMKPESVLGFDGRMVPASYARQLERICMKKNIVLKDSGDPAEGIWENRPERACKPVYVLDLKFAGESVSEKLERVKKYLKETESDFLFLSSLDDIMWLYNLRGDDVECNPVALSYAYITEESQLLFIQENALTGETKNYLSENRISWRPYDTVFDFLTEETSHKKGIAQKEEISCRIYEILRRNGVKETAGNPVPLWKAVKNETEIKNMEYYFLLDSVSVCKFIYWLKQNREEPDEIQASGYLDRLRSLNPDFCGLSFPTISAYGSNAAMMHYEAQEGRAAKIRKKGFLLVDSGGQYKGATTDVTRTIVTGELSEEEKKYFTLVAMGMLRLQNAVFLKGCTGRNLDILAREPLWEQGVDYKCATGHGVGYFLNVHEGPHAIRWKYSQNAAEAELEAGMTVTDEPGVYLEGKFGIRTENTLLVREKEENGDGTFLTFTPLTFVPIDLAAIRPDLMEERDKKNLNAYHALVFEKIAPYLEENERLWLKEATAPVF